MTVVALWLLIIPAMRDRPVSYVPFATKEACEDARYALIKHSRMIESGLAFCTQSGAKP